MQATDNIQLDARLKRRSAKNGIERSGGRIGMLDGLRGLALIAVIGYHVAPSKLPGGFLGVEAFFVLSGYLLAALLLEESNRSGTINLPAYARRRLRRIAPALIMLLLGLVVLAPLIAPADVYRLRGDVLSSLAGITNWRLIADGSSYFSQVGRPPLVRHLWSIAVEIQFYLVCPLLVAWILRKKRFSAIASLAGGIAASALLMAAMYDGTDPSRVYYGTDTRAGALLSGVLLAVLLGYRLSLPPDPSPGRWLQRFGLLSLGGLGLMVVFADETGRFMYPAGFLLTQIATMLVVTAGLRSGPVSALLDRRPLRWLGERCYGIYLWHWPAVALLRPGLDVKWPPALTAIFTIGFAVVLGGLSYRWIERPSFRRKLPRHAAPRTRPGVMRPAAVTFAIAPVVLLAIKLPTTNPIAESLREGQRVVANQGSLLGAGRAPLLLTPVDAGPVPGQAGPAPGAAGLVTAIGDSVMVGAAGALQEKLGPSGFIEAKLRRQFSEGIEVAHSMRRRGAFGDVAVVHLGNNGPVKPAQIDTLMAGLSGVRHVMLVTVRVGRPWTDSVNTSIKEAARRHPAVRVVDWHGFSAGHPDWFQSDGAHLKPSGARAYADLIAGALAALPPPPPPPATPAAQAAQAAAGPPTAGTAPPVPAPDVPAIILGR